MDTQKFQNIILGQYRLNLAERPIFVKRPSLSWQLEIADIQTDYIDTGLLTDIEYEYFLATRGLWLPKDDDKIESLNRDIEELKVRMFNQNFNTKEIDASRRVLKLATADLEKLFVKKNAYSFLSATANQALERMKLLFAGSLYDPKGEPLLKSPKQYPKFPCSFLDHAITQYRSQQADETEIRYFARTEPWRSFWVARKATGRIFDVPSTELTEQQRFIISWSTTLDAIAEHPQAPDDSTLADDARLDGWLILQKRERDKALGQSQLNQLIKDEKVRNSGEIFIPAGTKEDVEKIHALNTADAARIKNQRLAYVFKKGVVNEVDMPDSKLKIERMRTEKTK